MPDPVLANNSTFNLNLSPDLLMENGDEDSIFLPLSRFFRFGLASFLIISGLIYQVITQTSIKTVNPSVSLMSSGQGKVYFKDKSDWKVLAKLINLQAGMKFKTEADSSLEINFYDEANLRLSENSEVEVMKINKLDWQIKEMALRLEKGSLWLNNMHSQTQFNIFTKQVVAIPLQAAMGIKYEEGEAKFYADQHNVRLGLLAKNLLSGEEITRDEPIFLNNFLLTAGKIVTILENKITDKLWSLKYSKLIKEFPFTVMDNEAKAKDEFWLKNEQKDKSQLAKLLLNTNQNLTQKIAAFDMTFWLPDKVYQILAPIKRKLTFFSFKQREEARQHLESFLGQGIQAFINGEAETGLKILAQAQDFLQNSPWLNNRSDITLILLKDTEDILQDINPVLPGEPLYPVKEAVVNFKQILLTKTKADVIDWQLTRSRQILDEIADLLQSRGEMSYFWAKNTFFTYERQWRELIKPLSNRAQAKDFLFDQWQILQNLLWRFPLFFDKSYFVLLTDLEKVILEVTTEENDKIETRLFFIDDKLKTLARLIYLIKKQEIAFAPALELGKHLIAQSEALKPELKVKVAVSDYFKEQLEEFNELLDFFSSPEFTALKGVFEEEAYAAFKNKKQEIAELQKYLKSLATPKKRTKITLDQAKDAVRRDWADYNIDIGETKSLGDPDYRLFEIQGVKVNGQEMKVKYDRDSKIVYEMQLGEEILTAGLHISNFPLVVSTLLLKQKEAPPMELKDSPLTEPESNRSKTEDIAVNLLLNDLRESGILGEGKNVTILNLTENLFQIANVYPKNEPILVFSFQYNLARHEGTSLQVKTKKGEKAVSGTYSLLELITQARKAYKE